MGLGTRAATCASCSKRLNRKSWYYRNGKYFCKQRCWVTEREKAATEAKKQKEAASAKAEQEAAAPASEKPAPAKS